MKNHCLTWICFIGCLLVSFHASGQEDKSARPSPPAMAKGTIKKADISIHYSSPSVKGRVIWGGLVPYDKIWRTGANEATIFETNKKLKVNGAKLPAGKYGLFSIPGETEWTFIFNEIWDQWGAYKYDETKDVLRVKAVPQKSDVFHETMLFEIKDKMVVLSWENLSVGLEIN